MKIRLGFVTNSSSSSYILEFADKERALEVMDIVECVSDCMSYYDNFESLVEYRSEEQGESIDEVYNDLLMCYAISEDEITDNPIVVLDVDYVNDELFSRVYREEIIGVLE